MKQKLRHWLLRHHPELLSMWLALRETAGGISYARRNGEAHDEISKLETRLGPRVLDGPFRGMLLSDDAICSERLPKLVGSYELELHELIERLISKRFRQLFNVGCAEGYYAVGFALRCPDLAVTAVDPLKEAKRRLRRLSCANGVENRISFRRFCSARSLGKAVDKASLIVMDCEGAEFGLLDPAAAKNLQHAEVLVEVHDFAMPGLTDELINRFTPTHHCKVIEQAPRDASAFACLSSLTPDMQRTVLDERRPKRLKWLHLEPRA